MQDVLELNSFRKQTDLQIVVLPCRAPTAETIEYYNSAYATWKEVWKKTLLELDGSDELYSDQFTRQDYAVTIFHGDKCVALVCFRRANLAHAAHREDSWFKAWPQELRDQLGRDHNDGMAISWVTMLPDYRKTSAHTELRDLNIIDRLAEAMNFFLQDSGVETGFGVTRNNRSVDKFGAYAGAKPMMKKATLHGVEVDLVTLSKRDVYDCSRAFPAIAFDLWSRRLVFFDQLLRVAQEPAKPVRRSA